jgi:hypothetical protein
MSDKENTYYSGPTTFGLLGVVFVTLKLCGVINWSWWWVTAPFWGGAAFATVVLLIAEHVDQKRK